MLKVLSLKNRAWSASLLNVLAMALQLRTVWTSEEVSGVSLGMLFIFLYVQITFAQVGHNEKSWALFWGMAISAILNTIIIVLVVVRIYGLVAF